MTPASKRRLFCVYILASRSRALYVAVTNDLERRVNEHKHKKLAGFTARYWIDRLVYFEQYDDASAAIARDKQIKGWKREKKVALIRSMNPRWRDLNGG